MFTSESPKFKQNKFAFNREQLDVEVNLQNQVIGGQFADQCEIPTFCTV